MKLKSRLTISFLIILLVPIILGAFVLVGANVMQRRNGTTNYSVTTDFGSVENSYRLLSSYSDRAYSKIESWANANDEEELLEISELQKLNNDLKINEATYILVRMGTEIYYDGTDGEVTIDESELPDYGDNSTSVNIILYLEDNQPALLRQLDFESASDVSCTLFTVTTTSSTLPETKRYILDIGISILLILILTAVILVGWIYQGIVPRLRTLVEATESIKEGNLDNPIRDVGGNDEISELFCAFEDMRRRLSAQAKEKMQYEEDQRQLLRNIAHDLKTPITSIKGYAEGIMDGVANTPEKQERYLKTICNKADEMNTLINELTLYSKLDTNRIPYNFQRVNVKEYFLECAEELGEDLALQNVEFSFYNYVDDNVEIIADPEQLERVIHNIVRNSVKYKGSDPLSIQLRTKDVGDFIQVEIEDNGKGISQQDLPHIFERTFRADSSRNSNVGGSGIGLSIVKKIIEEHGGSIWATSKERQGTVMYFVIRKYEEAQNG